MAKMGEEKKPKRPEKSGAPHPTHDFAAEQVRETEESRKARTAEASNRKRMVEIGRGNKQAGRQTKS